MITAFIIVGGITLAIRELDPAIQQARKEEMLNQKKILFLR